MLVLPLLGVEIPLKIRVLLLIRDDKKWSIYLKGILNFIYKDIQHIKTYNYTALNFGLIYHFF